MHEKGNPFLVAKSHLKRVRKGGGSIEGDSKAVVRARREKYLAEVRKMTPTKRKEAIAALEKRLARLERSGLGVTSEINWKLIILNSFAE